MSNESVGLLRPGDGHGWYEFAGPVLSPPIWRTPDGHREDFLCGTESDRTGERELASH